MGGVFTYIIPTHKTKVMGLKRKLWFIFLNCAFDFGFRNENRDLWFAI
jgi:hypothetical protein